MADSNTILQDLRIAQLTLDPTLSAREALCLETVERYKAVVDSLPPVDVYRLDGAHLLADGFHRVEARRQLGMETVPANVRQGTRAEAEEHAILSNISHGRPYTQAERRRAIGRLLRLHPERSNAWLARDLAVSSHTVETVRRELEATLQIARLERLVGDDGKERPRQIAAGPAALDDDGRGAVHAASSPATDNGRDNALPSSTPTWPAEMSAAAQRVGQGASPLAGLAASVDEAELGPAPPSHCSLPDIPAPQALPPGTGTLPPGTGTLPPGALLVQGNAIRLPLRDAFVHSVIFSPPYWAMRSYAGGGQAVVWPGVSYEMPGGKVSIPGDLDCEHEWATVQHRIHRGKTGDRSTLTGGQNNQAVSRLVAPSERHGDLPATEFVGQAVSSAICARCGAWRGSLGLEPTPERFVGHIVLLLREIRRVLRDDGACWLNLGFSHYGSWGNYGSRNGKQRASHTQHWYRRGYEDDDDGYKDRPPTSYTHPVYKDKDVVPIPWLVGVAAQHDGWWLRSPVVWSKPNSRPDSTRDRPSLDYEHVLLLTPNSSCYFDMDAVREPAAGSDETRFRRATWDATTEAARLALDLHAAGRPLEWSLRFALGLDPGRQVAEGADLWRINTWSYRGAHYATWPPALVARMVQASTSPAVCSRCGRPWRRVAGQAADGETGRASWRADCDCFDHAPAWNDTGDEAHPACTLCGEIHTAPAIVLDVTAGSGTTVQVAQELGRTGLGVDISGPYLHDQAHRRVSSPSGAHPRLDIPAIARSRPLPENDWLAGAMEEILPGLPERSVDLVFLDPPFNLGKRYGRQVDDDLTDGRYAAQWRAWLDAVLPLVRPAGSIVLHHIPLQAVQIAACLQEQGWLLRRWVAWKTTAGRPGKRLDMVPRHYPFLWFSRGNERINKVLTPHPRCSRCGQYSDHWGGKEQFRDPTGQAMGDVWLTPTRVLGRGKTRRANELPLDAVLRWVLALTNPGDYVFDPFLGSGTTGAACEFSRRRWGGVERVRDNGPAIRVKTLVARGAARVVDDVGALPADHRYALTKALERAWGEALRDGEAGDEALLEIGAQTVARALEGERDDEL